MLIKNIFNEDRSLNWEAVMAITEFAQLDKTPHSKRWHKEGGVIEHTKRCVDFVYNKIKDRLHKNYNEWYQIMMTAALFHDIGKGTTTYWDEKEKDWCCRNHGEVGARIFRNIFFEEDVVLREKVCWLIRNHMALHHAMMKSEEKKEKEIVQLMNGLIPLNDMLVLHEADCRSSINDDNTDDKISKHIKEIREYAGKLKISGKNNLWSSVNEDTPRMYVLIGIPGAGKSTFAEKIIDDPSYAKGSSSKMPIVSRDIIRAELGFCEVGEKYLGTKSEEEKVTKTFNDYLVKYASQNQSFIIDNTSLKKKYRQGYCDLVKDYNIAPIFVYVEAPSLKANIERREGEIDPLTIHKMWDGLEFPSRYECYEMIFVDQRKNKITKM